MPHPSPDKLGMKAYILLFLLAVAVLCACDSSQQSEVSNGVSVPLPVGTASYPTSTPAPTEPYYTATPLPPPPVPATFPPAPEPVPNIAWSAQSDDALAIWVGHYGDDPSPAITGARMVARWTGLRLDLASMAASADGNALAILLPQVCVPEPPPPTPTPDSQGVIPSGSQETNCEGDNWPRYAYVVDLPTGKVQSIPDYRRQYQAYADYNIRMAKIVGWFDNSRFGITDESIEMFTATRDGLSFVPRHWPDLSAYYYPYYLSLLPDHKTIFAWVGDSFFFRDAPTGAVHKVGDLIQGTSMNYLAPSPDGKLVSSLEPEPGMSFNDSVHYGLWVQELASGSRTMLVDKGVWDTRPAWSPDSSRIAFAHTDKAPSGDHVWVALPESADTNIYISDVSAHTSRRLTSFTGAHNSNIQWTTGGNLVLSSTAGNSKGRTDLAAVSTTDGKLTTLVAAKQGEQLLHPLLFGVEIPGMPDTGAGPNHR